MEKVLVAMGTWFAANGVIVALFVRRARRLGRLGPLGRSRTRGSQSREQDEVGDPQPRHEDSPRPVA